ncbi:MAG: hypothetical protein ACXAEX_02535, partial [Promethearchaeota archaeon]
LKINIKSEILIFIIHACLFRKKILVLMKKEYNYLIPELNSLIDYIFQTSFTGDILIKSKSQFKKNRQLYEGYIVMDEKEIVNETRRLINSNQLRHEVDLIRTFYNNSDHNSGVVDLKERLEGTYILTKHLFNYYERKDEKNPISPRTLIKHLEESLSVKKIRKQYLYFLTDVIRAYFGLNIIWEWDIIGEKIDGLWHW